MVTQATLAPPRNYKPCPVDWCPEDGHHEWARLDHISGSAERWHTLSVQDYVDGDGDATSEVAVECCETTDGAMQTLIVLFNGYSQLSDRGEVDQLIAALHHAADLAFGPMCTAVGMGHAAIAEVTR